MCVVKLPIQQQGSSSCRFQNWKFGDYAGAKGRGFKVENVCPSFKQKNVLAESSTRQHGDNTGEKETYG